MSIPIDVVNAETLVNKLCNLPHNISAAIIEKALTLYVILTDKKTPAWARALVLVALVYLINPLDTIPDIVPVLGYTDDFSVMVLALERISRLITPPVKKRVEELMSWEKKQKTIPSDNSDNEGKEN